MKKMKRSLCWLLTLVMVFSMMATWTIGASAASPVTDTGSCGPNVTYTYYDATPGDNTPSGVLTLTGVGPTNDYKVSYGTTNSIFTKKEYRDQVAKIVIQTGVTTIGTALFYRLPNCSEVIIPEGVTTIGEWAFAHMESLRKIALPSTLLNVRHYAFLDSGLDKDGIKNSTCAGTPFIDNMDLGGGETSNQELVNDLTSSVSGNIAVTASGSLDKNTLWSYSDATKTLTISSKPGTTGNTMKDFAAADVKPWAAYATVIEHVLVTQEIDNIGQYVFSGLTALKSATFAEQVTVIESYAFSGATSLKKLSLPASVTTIEPYAFHGCTGLTVSTPNSQTAVGATFSTSGNAGVTYKFSTTGSSNDSAYITSTFDGGALTWIYIPITGDLMITPTRQGEMVAIPNYTSAKDVPWKDYAAGIKSVTLQEGITSVGKYAFSSLPNLKKVNLSATLEEIDEYSFAYDSSINELIIPLNVRMIMKYAFTGCTGLTYAYTPNNFITVEDTGNEPLLNCLQKGGDYNNPNPNPGQGGTTNPGDGTTNPGDGTTNPGDGTTNPGDGTTNPGDGTTNPGDGTTNPGDGTTNPGQGGTTPPPTPPSTTYKDIENSGLQWYYNPSNKTLYIRVNPDAPDGASTAIPDYAAASETPWKAHLSELVSISMTGVTAVGTNAFKGSIHLVTLTIPAEVTSLGTGAFSNCTSLTTIYMENTMKPLTSGVFNGCSAIKTIDYNGYRAEWDIMAENADPEIAKNLEGKLKCKAIWTFIYHLPSGDIIKTTVEGVTGTKVEVAHPKPDGYIAHGPIDLEYVFGIEKNREINITYEPIGYTVTIVFKDLAGNTIRENATVTVSYGQTTTYKLPTIPHYDAVVTEIDIPATGDQTIEVKYRERSYFYTIVYVSDKTGKELATVKVENVKPMTAVEPKESMLSIPAHYSFASFAWADGTNGEVAIRDNTSVLTVKCTPDSKKVSVAYVDDLGMPIVGAPNTTFTMYYDEDIDITKLLATCPGHISAGDIVIKAADYEKIGTTYTVKQERKTYTITIKFQNTSLNTPMTGMTAHIKTLRYGESYSFKLSAPENAAYAAPFGYEADVSEIVINSLNEETTLEYTINYSLKKYNIIINFYQDQKYGEAPYASYTIQNAVTHGESFSYDVNLTDYPAPEGYELTQVKYTLNNVQTNAREIDVIYTRKTYKVTVQFIENDAFGRPIFVDSYTEEVKHGAAFTFNLDNYPKYQTPYYTVDKNTVSLDSVTADETLTILYTKKALTLTVKYMDGDTLIRQLDIPTLAGKTEIIPALTLEGYLATRQEEVHMDYENKEIEISLQATSNDDEGKNPGQNPGDGDDSQKNDRNDNGLKIVLVILLILLVLIVGGILFYFLYFKKKSTDAQ